MSEERLPLSLLNGSFFHCKPNEDGQVVEASVTFVGDEMPLVEKAVVCPARQPRSRCGLRKGDYCHWYKGDGFGYMIIGPGMDKKMKTAYKNN